MLVICCGKSLDHGCARVAHCVTARWRNFSHFCRPLRQYDERYVFWAQRSTDRCADSTQCTRTRIYSARRKYVVRHWTSREASLRHSSGWGTSSVSPQYRDLRIRGLTLSKAEINLSLSSVVCMPELHNRIDIYLKKYFSCIVTVWFLVLNYEEPKYSSFTVLYLNYLKIWLDHCCAWPFNYNVM